MSTNNPAEPALTGEEVAVLARHAGLTISDERLPMIAHELTIARQAADDLLPVPTADVVGVAEQFDPTWPPPSKRRGTRDVS